MGNPHPLVSIVIPVYNGANYMAQAIDSALAQTYDNIEIIVVNDGSKDDGATERIALSYGNKIRYFAKPNGGVSSALNYGIKQMKGEYFSWLSHDDMYLSEKIEHQIEALSKYDFDKSIIALCSASQINKDSEPIHSITNSKRFESNVIISWEEVLLDLLKNGAFNGCALLIPKNILLSVEPFDESLRFSQDALMWYRIFLAGYKLLYTEKKDVLGRVHNAQVTQTRRDLMHSDSKRICDMMLPSFLEKSTEQYNFLFAYAKRNAILNNCSVVSDCIKKGEKANLISFTDRVKLNIYLSYGHIRPMLRSLYHTIKK